MNRELLSGLIRELREEIPAAWMVYRRVLNLENPTAQDLSEFRDASRVLGKNADAVAADAKTLETALSISEECRRWTALDLEKKLAAGEAAIVAHVAEFERIVTEMKEKEKRLRVDFSNLQGQQINAVARYASLNGLKHKHPELLESVPGIDGARMRHPLYS